MKLPGVAFIEKLGRHKHASYPRRHVGTGVANHASVRSPYLEREVRNLLARFAARALPCRTSPEQALYKFRTSLVARNLSANTVRAYVWSARRLLKFVGKPVEDISPSDLDRFRADLVTAHHHSAGSGRLVTFALRSFFEVQGLDTANQLRLPRPSRRLPRHLSESTVAALLQGSQSSPLRSAVLSILAYGGLRVSEVSNLEISDVDLEGGVLRVRSGKGRKDRYVPMDPAIEVALRRYFEWEGRQTRGMRVFPREGSIWVQRLVRAASRDAGIAERVTPHTLRHSLATALLRRGCDVRYLQELLGHSSLATTEIYTHVDKQSLRAALERARPRFGPIPSSTTSMLP